MASNEHLVLSKAFVSQVSDHLREDHGLDEAWSFVNYMVKCGDLDPRTLIPEAVGYVLTQVEKAVRLGVYEDMLRG